ncbi:MAG TPA: hypothetical protein P5250_05860 [Bacteroidales bacterium]|nr:hypothetical protein [Bacteroidales bacterium]
MIFSNFNLFSQKRNYQLDPPNEKYAKDFMANGNYVAAINEYKMLLEKDSLNYSYNHNIGICYLSTDIDKTKALLYLERASSNPKADPNVWYDLGRAYQYSYRFDDAIAAFTKFKDLVGSKNTNRITPERQIEICNNAKEMIKHPINVVFENLGPAINSPYPDYNPYISKDESFIIFNSKRKGNLGNIEDFDGYNTADLYLSEFKYNEWKKAKRFSNAINTPLVEEIVGMSNDGTRLYVFVDNEFGRFEVFESKLVGKNYQKLISLGSNINYSNKLVTAATISKDKKVLFFASDRGTKDSYGGLDIYMSTLLPSGTWGPAVNIGNVVNTEYDEDFPYLAPDGKTLYFASMGHNTIGDFDIFKTTWDRETNTFSKPINLGYPVNNPEDNKTISFTSSGRYAYMHARKPDTYGDLDIYRLIFKDINPIYSVINGYILSTDSIPIYEYYKTKFNNVNTDTTINIIKTNNSKNKKGNKEENIEKTVTFSELNIEIFVYDKDNNTIYGKYKPNKYNSKYTIILPPGRFIIQTNSNLYKTNTFELYIEDRDSREINIFKNIRLENKD